jgi:hypothetical protein
MERLKLSRDSTTEKVDAM